MIEYNEITLKKRLTVDIRSTLIQFAPGQSWYFPFHDIKNEDGTVIVGSNTTTETWSARYQTMKRNNMIEGVFTFNKVSREPVGTIITRIK